MQNLLKVAQISPVLAGHYNATSFGLLSVSELTQLSNFTSHFCDNEFHFAEKENK